MGKLMIVIVPRITVTNEITIATIGRLMKNLDIRLISLGLCGKRLGVHLHARPHLLHALGNHAFARLQPLRNDPLGSNAVAHWDRPYAPLVLAVHNGYLISPL